MVHIVSAFIISKALNELTCTVLRDKMEKYR